MTFYLIFFNDQGAHSNSGLTGESRPFPTCKSGGLLNGEPKVQSGALTPREPSVASTQPPCSSPATSSSHSAALWFCEGSSGHPGRFNSTENNTQGGHPSSLSAH